MLELLYTALLYLIQPLIWIRLWVRGRKAPAYRKRWGERYGFYRHPLKPGGIMLHSVSVGETLAETECSIIDRKSTRLNSSHVSISYAVFCLKKKKNTSTNYSMHR